MKYLVFNIFKTGKMLSPFTLVMSPPASATTLATFFISGEMWASIIS